MERVRHSYLLSFAATCIAVVSAGLCPASAEEDFSKNYGYKFTQGAGFYAVTKGCPVVLAWVRSTTGTVEDKHIVTIPLDTQFYSYGIDFSRQTMPPHLLGYGFSYFDDSGTEYGKYIASFIPVAGYEEKVYRVVFRGPYEDLRNEKINYRFWVFNIPGSNGGYLFRFASQKAQEEKARITKLMTDKLSNSNDSFPGMLAVHAVGRKIPFRIRFTSYDPATGTLAAEVSDIDGDGLVKFSGTYAGGRELKLQETGGDVIWMFRGGIKPGDVEYNPIARAMRAKSIGVNFEQRKLENWVLRLNDQTQLVGNYDFPHFATTAEIEIQLKSPAATQGQVQKQAEKPDRVSQAPQRTTSSKASLRAIIERAVTAEGGLEQMAKYKRAFSFAMKGTATEPQVGDIPFTCESQFQYPDSLREAWVFQVRGKTRTLIRGIIDDQVWMVVDGTMLDVNESQRQEMQEQLDAQRWRVSNLLTEKGWSLSAVEDQVVNKLPAVGVRAVSPGKRTKTLYFDKESGRLVKVAFELEKSGTKNLVEAYLTDYQPVDGLTMALCNFTFWNNTLKSKLRITDMKFLDHLPESVFRKPASVSNLLRDLGINIRTKSR